MSSQYTAIESDVPQAQPAGATGPMDNQMGGEPNSAQINSDPSSWTWIQRLKQLSHPVALLFYIGFRILPIEIYIFGNFFIGFITKKNRFILHFIVLVLLISGDFWNLKNVAGRLLVGLRWWNEVNFIELSSTGEFENVWVFESADPSRYINPIDSKVFWTLLYGQPVAWIVLGILAVLKFEFLYLILILIGIFLSFTNALAFTKCDKFGKANNLATGFLSRASGTILSRLNPFASR